jgi:hypothetical protein
MTDRRFSLLSFPVVMALLVVLTLGLVFLGRWYWDLGLNTFLLLAVPLVLAVVYLAWYRTLPYVPSRPQAGVGAVPADEDEEPFEDPVEEADLLDDAEEEGKAPEEPVDAADDLEPEPPKSP